MLSCFLLGSVIAYGFVVGIYRLHVHPLSKFPGPRLAGLTGLYELYFAAWGADSFSTEIERMHQKYGPVVRITPDEVHVQEQLFNPDSADDWIKGTKALDARRHQSGYPSQGFQIRKRSILRVGLILQVEVHQIIRGLVQKHQIDRVFSSQARSLVSIPEIRPLGEDAAEGSDLEDGPSEDWRSPRPYPQRSMSESSKDYLPPCPTTAVPKGSGVRLPIGNPYLTVQRMSR
ncbi:hypothetical protein N7462_006621 [Penicillium macrosclerotiorum]|uniref:uncharacterized protein n=1 Tax=Penicillium macrosclerotiorum TaxID=303699 RepID=UPI002546E534|nr:uncharacterized protein N7462_006621 [Penicillium macrosclerotiorum]KAJ5683456.1 hypothetical protein N7462_006621 [Penicillium macrosclerotiorum]